MRLYNDRDEVMRRLAPALESAFEVDPSAPPQAQPQTRPSPPAAATAPVANGNRSDIPEIWPEAPIARVNSVAPSSPAADAVS